LELSAMGVAAASGKPTGKKLRSGIVALDDFLGGGLPRGAITEWGAPLGQGGRDVLLAWLAQATQGRAQEATAINGVSVADMPSMDAMDERPVWALWVHGRDHLMVYPPAWLARGVALQRMRFACSTKPLAELRPVFMEPLFRIIVLDAPRQFTDDDCAFVARQARLNDQVVVLIRDAFLGADRGNVWARLRLNCWYEPTARQYALRVVRGLPPRQLALIEDEIGHACGREEDGSDDE
jgi:RecA/RadA recombinase